MVAVELGITARVVYRGAPSSVGSSTRRNRTCSSPTGAETSSVADREVNPVTLFHQNMNVCSDLIAAASASFCLAPVVVQHVGGGAVERP